MTSESHDAPTASAERDEPLPTSSHAATEISEPDSASSDAGDESTESAESQADEAAASGVTTAARPKQRLLIGSQRTTSADSAGAPAPSAAASPSDASASDAVSTDRPAVDASQSAAALSEPPATSAGGSRPDDETGEDEITASSGEAALSAATVAPKSSGRVAVPNLREDLSPDLQAELDAAIGSAGSLDDAMAASASEATGELAPHATVVGTVVSIRQEDVFVDVGTPHQGIVPLKQFGSAPSVGTKLEVVVVRFDAGEGLYELTIPGKATAVADWSQVAEGQIVEATVTGTNKGGLDVQVSHLHGFVPPVSAHSTTSPTFPISSVRSWPAW
ncbi:MAG: hypothetical protein R3C10_00235 [Pirellulales bacterium]